MPWKKTKTNTGCCGTVNEGFLRYWLLATSNPSSLTSYPSDYCGNQSHTSAIRLPLTQVRTAGIQAPALKLL